MAIIYVDYENGNDSNDGTTFANRKKTIQSASTGASAGDVIRLAKSPDPTSIGNGTIPTPHGSISYTRTIGTITYSNVTGSTNITVTNHSCATGDIVEISNNSNSYYINGVYEVTVVDSNNLTLNNYNAGANTSGSGGNFRVISGKCIKLASAPVKNVASFASGSARTAWTASADVTTSIYFNYGDYSTARGTMQGGYSDQIEIGANFTTGKAAYYTLPSTLDLSGYQQLSLNIHQYSGTKVNAGNYSLKLCSDTTGDTAVNTFTIPQPGATSGSTYDYFTPITVDLGTNLGSSIQSIALYVDSDQGAQNIRICNIIACKAKSSADSLTLNSLVGRNSTTVDDQKFWYSIEAIEGDGDIVVVGPAGRPNSPKNSFYYGIHSAWLGDTGGTYTFYKRECFDTTVNNNATGNSVQVQYVQTGGSSSAKITISGGWDTSDSMTTRNGMTFYDGICLSDGEGIVVNYKSYVTLENIGSVRYFTCFDLQNSSYISLKNCFAIHGGQYGVYMTYCNYCEDFEVYISCGFSFNAIRWQSNDNPKPKADGPYIRKMYISCVYNAMSLLYCGAGGTWEFDHIWMSLFTSAYISDDYGGWNIDNLTIAKGHSYTNTHLRFSNPRTSNGSKKIGTFNATDVYAAFEVDRDHTLVIDTFNYTANTAYGWDLGTYAAEITSGSVTKILDGTIDEQFRVVDQSKLYTKNVSFNSASYFTSFQSHANVYAADYDGVSGDYRNFNTYGMLQSDTSTRRTASGYSWKATMTSSDAKKGTGNEYRWDIAKVAVKANSQVTASVYVNRTGTGINGGLIVSGGQLAGFASTEDYCTGSAGSWEQVTVTGTPTEDGIITIQAEAYYVSNTTHYAYFDDFSITQA